jgi:uracil-DNA glycosylase family 4
MKAFSRGNINAKIMLIGQSPGKEDINHFEKEQDGTQVLMPIPFAGSTGKLLQKMLTWASIEEGDYILTNCTKNVYFKDGNMLRPPNEEEIRQEKDTLFEEIAKVNPKLIFTLGKEALWITCYSEKTSLEELAVSRKIGDKHYLTLDRAKLLNFKTTEKHEVVIPILPLYHPSAILRDKTGEKGYKAAVTKVLIDNKEFITNILGRLLI